MHKACFPYQSNRDTNTVYLTVLRIDEVKPVNPQARWPGLCMPQAVAPSALIYWSLPFHRLSLLPKLMLKSLIC